MARARLHLKNVSKTVLIVLDGTEGTGEREVCSQQIAEDILALPKADDVLIGWNLLGSYSKLGGVDTPVELVQSKHWPPVSSNGFTSHG